MQSSYMIVVTNIEIQPCFSQTKSGKFHTHPDYNCKYSAKVKYYNTFSNILPYQIITAADNCSQPQMGYTRLQFRNF